LRIKIFKPTIRRDDYSSLILRIEKIKPTIR
jgi:hypothetical protein